MTTTFTYGTDSFTPDMVDGWQQARPSRTREHPLISGGSDFTHTPPGPRSVRPSLIFATEADALAAEILFVTAPYVDVTSDERDVVAGRYVTADGGSIELGLDPQTRRVFIVAVDLTEMP